MLPALCHLWLRWSATPAPEAMGNPYDELLRDPKLPINTGCWVLALRILPLSR